MIFYASMVSLMDKNPHIAHTLSEYDSQIIQECNRTLDRSGVESYNRFREVYSLDSLIRSSYSYLMEGTKIIGLAFNSHGLSKLDVISKLMELKYLIIRDCSEWISHHTSFSKNIENLSQLIYLDLSFNALDILPTELCSLKNLEVLLLNDNRIVTIPDTINQLTHIKLLNLSNNEFTAIPNSLGFLVNVEEIDISMNTVTQFNDVLLKLPKIKKLNLVYNEWNSLPPSINALKRGDFSYQIKFGDKMIEIII